MKKILEIEAFTEAISKSRSECAEKIVFLADNLSPSNPQEFDKYLFELMQAINKLRCYQNRVEELQTANSQTKEALRKLGLED